MPGENCPPNCPLTSVLLVLTAWPAVEAGMNAHSGEVRIWYATSVATWVGTRQLPSNRGMAMPSEIEPLSSPRMARSNCGEEATILGISSWRKTAAPSGSYYLHGDLNGCLFGRIGPQLSVIFSRMHKNASRACIADIIRESLPPDLSLLAPGKGGAILAGFGAAETGVAVPAGTRQHQPAGEGHRDVGGRVCSLPYATRPYTSLPRHRQDLDQ
jgi:hypothetical protein